MLRSEKSAEEVRRIAAYVDHQRQQVMARQSRASALRMAMMAALMIADEYYTDTGHLNMPPAE
jgi:cell division protein ZapA (FtsZ GTPase activity inhibitor)